MDDKILLWQVSFDIDRPLMRTYIPLIPKSPMLGEDTTIPRICFAPSIEDCLNAMVADRVEQGLRDGFLLAFPFWVSKNDPNLKTPEAIGDMVPDAYWTKEHWYLKPVTLSGRLMQIDDFEDYEFFDAYESHRSLIYKVLLEHGIPSEELKQYDNWSTTEVLANVPTWLGYEIAMKLNIHRVHTFEWLNYHQVQNT